LFVVKESDEIKFEKGSYIRIKKGVYEGDLGKIIEIHKNSVDVLLVPRINVQELSIKIK
jgi:transcription antitermination factor NusG